MGLGAVGSGLRSGCEAGLFVAPVRAVVLCEG